MIALTLGFMRIALARFSTDGVFGTVTPFFAGIFLVADFFPALGVVVLRTALLALTHIGVMTVFIGVLSTDARLGGLRPPLLKALAIARSFASVSCAERDFRELDARREDDIVQHLLAVAAGPGCVFLVVKSPQFMFSPPVFPILGTALTMTVLT
jgi:hypothetical protein